MHRFKKYSIRALLVFAALIIVNQLTLIERKDLFDDEVQGNCRTPQLTTFYNSMTVPIRNKNARKSKISYNRDLVLLAYAQYGALSVNAYKEQLKKDKRPAFGYNLEKLPSNIVWQDRSIKSNGFVADWYLERFNKKTYKAYLAFRGTNPKGKIALAKDMFWGNFSWLTQIFYNDQYRSAREFTKYVQNRATQLAKKNKVKIQYYSVGHSLGGGLAQHIAYAFPCTSSVTILPSPVINKFRLAEPFNYSYIVHMHENHELLSDMYQWLLGERFTYNNEVYYLNNTESSIDRCRANGNILTGGISCILYELGGQHSKDNFTAAMMDIPLKCEFKRSKDCKIAGTTHPNIISKKMAYNLRCKAAKTRDNICTEYENKSNNE